MFSTVRKREVFIPLFSFIFLNLLVLFLWDQSIDAQRSSLQNSVNKSGELLSQKFLSIVKRDIQSLENLKVRLENTNGKYFEYWEHDAELILQQNASFKFIEWIDDKMIIQKINPVKGNEAAIGLDISKVDYRNKEWIKHSQYGSTNITSWFKMTQGGHAFLVDVPVNYNNMFRGTITAGMDFTKNLNAFAENLPDYSIEIRDDRGTIFYTKDPRSYKSGENEFVYSNRLNIDSLDNQFWSIRVMPTSASFLYDNSSSINNMLIFGLALSTLTSLLVYFHLRAKRETSRAVRAIKKLKITNKKLSKQRNRAERASQAKTDFLSNMSHEIRTPLNGILGLIQLLKNSNNSNNTAHYLKLMDKSSKNLLALVNDVLEIDKIESGEMSLNEVVFTPSKEIAALVSQFKAEFESKNLYLDLELHSESQLSVVGDEGKFNQVIINLIKNALKFTTFGGACIVYNEELNNDCLTIFVKISDTGIGMPQYNQSKIFKRFTQIDHGIKKKHEGSGLGLAISQNLVELMGGTITVNSQLGKGSVFSFEIPFKLSKTQPQHQLNASYCDLSFEHLKVLVVDDNKINLLVLSKTLENLGIKSEKANNGVSAVKLAKEKQFDLIFMDIHMPLMDGYEATRLIRETESKVLIIGLSADVTKQAIEKSLALGMSDYLTKPLSQDKIQNILVKYFAAKEVIA